MDIGESPVHEYNWHSEPVLVENHDRTGNPNAVVNARQKKVNTDYHSKSLDARGGDTRDGFEAELNS